MKKAKQYSKFLLPGVLLAPLLLLTVILVTEISHFPLPKTYNTKIELTGKNLNYYYIDFAQSKYDWGRKMYRFDEQQIPLFDHAGQTWYHPVLISQYALGAHDRFLETGDSLAQKAFLLNATWLRDHLQPQLGFYYWEYHFPIEFPGGIYNVPWFSAMTQGQGASVLLRAFVLTADSTFLTAARTAIEPLFHDLKDGGMSILKGEQYLFPQEYPTNPPSDILNGAIYATFGIYDYVRVTGDSLVQSIFEKIINTFASEIESYDTSNWSLYCRWPGYWATPHYNSDHITQLKILYQISGIEKFNTYAGKFEIYHFNWQNRARYHLHNHWRQIREFSLADIQKIPDFLKRTFNN